VSALENPQVAAWTISEPWAQLVEQLGDGVTVAQAIEGLAPMRHAVFLGQGDQRLGNSAKLFGLRHGRLDDFVLEQRRGHIAKHGFAVRAVAIQLSS
jgi:hypothetical protein